MQLKDILNLVEKQKGFVYESANFSADKKSILVGIRPRTGSRPICSGCGCHASGYDRLTERRFEFVPLWGLVVYFVYALRRVNCTSCGVKAERVPGSDGQHRTTYSYRLFLATWAGRFMDQWCVRAMRSKIDPMQEMAGTLRRHREILLNWFRARGEISNGSVEGMNNKAKLAIKKAYGLKSYKTLETALYHQLGNLPEPKTTHKFC